MSTRLTTACWFGFAAGLVLLGCVGCKRSVSVPALGSVTNIVFSVKLGPGTNDLRSFTVSDTNEIRQLVSFSKVSVKQPCACIHLFTALMQSPAGDIQVSFCDHCFDIVGGEFAGDYHMPSHFYDEFQKLWAHERAP
jgi:hypothetical protein